MFRVLSLITANLLQFTLLNGIPTEMVNHASLQSRDALDDEFPYMVSIRRTEFEQILGYSWHVCGGSLINNQTVLTAAHCLFDKFGNYLGNENSFTVMGGINNIDTQSDTAVTRKVKRIMVHPRYSKLDADIAVLIMEKPLEIDGIRIGVIDYAARPFSEGSVCEVLGWNRVPLLSSPSKNASNSLRVINTYLINRKLCAENYKILGINVTTSQLCTGHAINEIQNCTDSKGVMNPCNFGEILVCDGKVAGISSFENMHNFTNYPKVFTDVTKYGAFLGDPENYLPLLRADFYNETPADQSIRIKGMNGLHLIVVVVIVIFGGNL